MAKKKKPEDDDVTVPPVEETPAPIEAAVEPVPEPEPVAPVEPVEEAPTRDVPEFEATADGRWAAKSKHDRELFYVIGGVRHEHVTETPDGRWVYARS